MKKLVWVRADAQEWDDVKAVVVKALEAGADCILTNYQMAEKIKELGNIQVAVHADSIPMDVMEHVKNRDAGNKDKEQWDIVVIGRSTSLDGSKPLEDVEHDIEEIKELASYGIDVAALVVIFSKEYEELAASLRGICDYVIGVSTDWRVIPLENLIAAMQDSETMLLAGVDIEEAKLALQTLEVGVDGIVLSTDDVNEVVKTTELVEELTSGRVELIPAKIVNIKQVGMGDRVCVDTCAIMVPGEGMLVGTQAAGFFLVHSESEDSPYVAARPFRVNAGAVHAYIKVGEKTRYLSELQSGDEVMVVDSTGKTRTEVVGRVKIERRPLMLIEAEVKDGKDAEGMILKTILQNAETIKLVTPDGSPVSIASL
ncbi:MAG: 3-dehydroquinate synthase II, partial [Methermicoccaceae archaeon]